VTTWRSTSSWSKSACPQSLRVSGGGGHGGDGGGLPTSGLEDMADLRAFAFSDHANARAVPPPRGSGIHAQFSAGLFHDPALMADLVIVATAHAAVGEHSTIEETEDGDADSEDSSAEEDGAPEDSTEEEGWVRFVVNGAFPRRNKGDDDDAATVLRQPLLDSEEFALRVARGLLDGVAPESRPAATR
jgi:hypothetical protein